MGTPPSALDTPTTTLPPIVRGQRRPSTAWSQRGAASLLRMAYFRLRLGTTSAEFDKYRLDDATRPLPERLAYLSERRWRHVRSIVNRRTGWLLSDDKWVFSALMAQAGVPSPPVLGRFQRSTGCTNDGAPLRDSRDLIRLLARGHRDGLVFKDVRGRHGARVFVFVHADSQRLVTVAGEEWTPSQLDEHLRDARGDGYLVQARLRNHERLRGLVGETLSTVRVVTFVDRTTVTVLRATARLPLTDGGIDNFGAGNLAAPVNLETGVLGPASRLHDRAAYPRHPRTGGAIAGFALPHWRSVADVLTRAALALRPLHAIGWDVALTEGGPFVVEANRSWGVDLVQQPQGEGLWRGGFKAWCEREIARVPAPERVAQRLARAVFR